MSLLDEIGAYLEQNAIGKRGIDLFLSKLPASPDAAIAVIETGGTGPDYVLGQSQPTYENPSFQVIVRDKSYKSAREKAGRVWDLLARVANLPLGAGRYLQIVPVQSPFDLGPDENQREQVVANYEAMRAL